MSNEQNSVIVKDDECIESAMHAMRRALKKVDTITENYHPLMGGERYLTDKELSARLKVGRRTLQEYRTERTIPYIIFGGKALYRETDIEQLLVENYRKAIR